MTYEGKNTPRLPNTSAFLYEIKKWNYSISLKPTIKPQGAESYPLFLLKRNYKGTVHKWDFTIIFMTLFTFTSLFHRVWNLSAAVFIVSTWDLYIHNLLVRICSFLLQFLPYYSKSPLFCISKQLWLCQCVFILYYLIETVYKLSIVSKYSSLIKERLLIVL